MLDTGGLASVCADPLSDPHRRSVVDLDVQDDRAEVLNGSSDLEDREDRGGRDTTPSGVRYPQ